MVDMLRDKEKGKFEFNAIIQKLKPCLYSSVCYWVGLDLDVPDL